MKHAQGAQRLDEAAGEARVPPLLLQPLVENAVRHGVEPAAEGGTVRIRTRVKLGRAQVVIANTVPATPSRPGSGMALKNVRERLHLMHDMAAQFEARMGFKPRLTGGRAFIVEAAKWRAQTMEDLAGGPVSKGVGYVQEKSAANLHFVPATKPWISKLAGITDKDYVWYGIPFAPLNSDPKIIDEIIGRTFAGLGRTDIDQLSDLLNRIVFNLGEDDAATNKKLEKA